MKYTLLLTVLVAAVLALGLTACSPDIEEEVEEETILTPEPEPEPDWVDGVLTITVGNYQTGEEMFTANEKRFGGVGGSICKAISNPDLPMLQQKSTIDIAVVKLLEAGLDKPVTIEEIKNRYKELGYRPLTLEEAVELRLQFTEQPDISTCHRMSRFYILLKDTEHLTMEQNRKVHLLSMLRHKAYDNYNNGYTLRPHSTESRMFDPAGEEVNPTNGRGKTSFQIYENDMVKGFAGVVE